MQKVSRSHDHSNSCGRIETDAGLFLAFHLPLGCKAIYDHDISISSLSRPVNEVSGALLLVATCWPIVSEVFWLLKPDRWGWDAVCKRLANVCRFQNSCQKTLQPNKLNFKKSVYSGVITDEELWGHLVEHRGRECGLVSALKFPAWFPCFTYEVHVESSCVRESELHMCVYIADTGVSLDLLLEFLYMALLWHFLDSFTDRGPRMKKTLLLRAYRIRNFTDPSARIPLEYSRITTVN